MARAEYADMDIKIFLSEEEAIQLGSIAIDGNKVVHPPLEIPCQTRDKKLLTTVVIQIVIDDQNLGPDGIKVERQPSGFRVYINNTAYWRIRDKELSGTRYDGQNKIHFTRDEFLSKTRQSIT